MAKLIVGAGIGNYIDSLEKLADASDDMIGKAIFAGANVVTNKIRSAVSALPVESSKAVAAAGGKMTGVSSTQKAGLLSGLGISHMQLHDGNHDVKVGFDGYNRTKTERWPNGQPNAMIARSLESGTSFRVKNPIISKATRASKDEAEQAMAKAFDDELEARFNF